MPQVALLNGTIHLLYIQGKREKPEPLAEGLSRGGQSPRPFFIRNARFQIESRGLRFAAVMD